MTSILSAKIDCIDNMSVSIMNRSSDEPAIRFSTFKNQLDVLTVFVDEDKWKTEAKTEGGSVQEYTISYQNLAPTSSYKFRVIAYNKFSISYPAESNHEV